MERDMAFIRVTSRRKARGLGERPWLGFTLVGEALPAVGGFALAQAVPELLGEEVP